MLDYPLKIVSDLHYKSPGSRLTQPEHLHPIFEGFRTVILNGDTLEYLYYGKTTGDKHKAEITKVAEITGTRLIWINGNHDPELGEKEYAFVHRHRRIRVTHGDFDGLRMKPSRFVIYRRPLEIALYYLQFFRWFHIYFLQSNMGLKTMADGEILILGHTHRYKLIRHDRKTLVNLGAHIFLVNTAWVEVQSAKSEVVLVKDGVRIDL